MADISLIHDDALDDCDEGVFEQGDGASGEQGEDDPLSPFAQFQKYALSDNVFNRQMVPSILKELFKNSSTEALSRDLPEIMKLLSKLAFEDEIMVRTYILEQVPNLALVALDCVEQVPELNTVFTEYLLPLIVRNLGNNDNQVRKTAQSTLFVLIENGLLTRQQAESQVCPTILALSNVESLMDYHTGTVTLMSKLAPFLGSEITERMFLIRFSELCSNDMFYVRKVCASHFGDFCAVIGKEAYEKTLLPCYLSLCNDDIWGVRKACAEVATSVSCPCPSAKRHTVLAPVFAKLLQDQSRWVRMSAFQTLGPFISTFADPSISNLAYNSIGELVVVYNDGTEFRINPNYSESTIFGSVLHKYQDIFNILGDEQDTYKDDDEDINEDVVINSQQIEVSSILLGNNPENSGPSSTEPKNDATENIIQSCNENDHTYSALPEEPASSESNDKICTKIFMNMLNINDTNSDSLIQGTIFSDITVLNKKNDSLGLKAANSKESDTIKSDEMPNGSGDICNVSSNEHHDVNEFNNYDKDNMANVENSEAYNSFNFWYISPEMPLDVAILNPCLPSEIKEENHVENYIVMEHCDMLPSTDLIDLDKCKNMKKSSIFVQEKNSNVWQCDNKEKAEPVQHIVPQILIDHFISMTDPDLADNTDKDLAYHCAYSLPAVALTLGKHNWYLLKNTVEILAGNIHYKVRRTVASSLHELAVIIGSDMATSNLTPIFDEFIKDLDEVRIGVLEHLAHFLGLINETKRNVYLPRFVEFLPAKNLSRSNWRFRKELAEQLHNAVTLFRPNDVCKYVSDVAQQLLCDKVAAVRESALLLVTEIVRYISTNQKLTSRLLVKLAEKFAHSTNWKRRQTFCLLCANLLMSNALDLEQFASDVMPHLLDLSWDPVPNVRLVVGRTISQNIATSRYFFDIHSQHYDSIHSVLRRLQSDKDRDVRSSALISKNIVDH